MKLRILYGTLKEQKKPGINEGPKDALLRQYQEEMEFDLVMQILGNSCLVRNIINEETHIQKANDDLENERRQFKAQNGPGINKIKEQKNKDEE